MGYVIVGGVCLVIGAFVGILTIALLSINRNTEEVTRDEDR